MSLFLVDGHALAYRSYYAFVRRPLVNSRGDETSAVFGFARTLLNLLEKYDPSHIAVVFDGEEATFRSGLFAGYKANRPKMPDSLGSQMPTIFTLVGAMSIPLLSLEGYEADDIIATLSKRTESQTPVRIVSADKDLFQVVSERTHVIRPGKNGLLDEEINLQRLRERFGMSPGQFVDYQALMGDPSDNVPGVPGVGEKTAQKLIQQFGSLERLYDSIDQVPSEALRERLTTHKDQAFLSRQLVRLDDSVPVDARLDDMARRPFDAKTLRSLLHDLEFFQMLDELPEPEPEPGAAAERALSYALVDSTAALDDLSKALEASVEFAVDVEASDIDPMRAVLAGVSLAIREGAAWYVPVTSVIEEEQTLLTPPMSAPGLPVETVRQRLGPVLRNPIKRKIGQNIKYDAIVLANAGLELSGVAFDTMLASYCLHPGGRSHGLDALADEMFNHKKITFKSLFDPGVKRKDIRRVPVKRVCEYACEDADFTLRLKNVFAPMLEASQVKELFETIEMPLCDVLVRMELRGVALDVPFLAALSKELDGRLTGIQQSIYREVGEEFNINSTAKVQEILFSRLKLKPTHRTKTGYSTDVDVLKSLASQHVIPSLIIEYRMLSKLQNTYIDALPKLVNPRTGRVHTSYNQAVATTGRLSSSDPNLQNIPIRTPLGREIRKAFVAGEPGWVLLDADYSQIELRLMAHLSRDAELLQAFAEDADVHRRTAARIMGVEPGAVTDGMRARAKTVNFGIMYGMGARGLAQALEIDVAEAKSFIDDYFKSYPGVRRYIDETIAKARQDKAVSTLYGRVRQLPDIDSSHRGTRAFAERTAVNTPIQGSAADIIKVAMVDLDSRLRTHGLAARMILQVHDELVIEVPEPELEQAKQIVREAMENAVELSVPLKVDMAWGRNWLEAHG
jgi:DNA polymerase-1